MWLCALVPYILWTQNLVLGNVVTEVCSQNQYTITQEVWGDLMTLAFLQVLESV
jgi:hypothetical protein